MAAGGALFLGFFTLLFLVFLFGGGVLVGRGWRGRLVFEHPTCARCRYDLRRADGVMPTACPECGADLAGGRGVSYGRAAHHVGRIVAGVLLACTPIVLWIGTVLFLQLRAAGNVTQAQAQAQQARIAAEQARLQAESQLALARIEAQAVATIAASALLERFMQDPAADPVRREIERRREIGELERDALRDAVLRVLRRADSLRESQQVYALIGRWVEAGVLTEEDATILRRTVPPRSPGTETGTTAPAP